MPSRTRKYNRRSVGGFGGVLGKIIIWGIMGKTRFLGDFELFGGILADWKRFLKVAVGNV